jgi:hypothetical protein
MATVRIKLEGIELIVNGDVDGHQWYIDSIELANEDDLTDLLMSLKSDDIETRCAENYESEPDEDMIYEYSRESKYD